MNKIIQGDALEVLRTIPDQSVQCVVTSPPYWGLRQYLFDKATVLRYNLTDEERKHVETELEKRKIKPRLSSG